MSPRLIVLGALVATGAGLLAVGQPASAAGTCRVAAGITVCAGADPSFSGSGGGVQANTAESVSVTGAFGPHNSVCVGRLSVDTTASPIVSWSDGVYQCY